MIASSCLFVLEVGEIGRGARQIHGQLAVGWLWSDTVG